LASRISESWFISNPPRIVCNKYAVPASRAIDARDLGKKRPQSAICPRFSQGELHGGAWASLNVGRAFGVVTRYVCEAFYAHPWAWNEIGFPGPAYPRGYSRFGSPHLRAGETETWEALEAYELDPVRDTRERGLD
jgi:hypothetical protein